MPRDSQILEMCRFARFLFGFDSSAVTIPLPQYFFMAHAVRNGSRPIRSISETDKLSVYPHLLLLILIVRVRACETTWI